MNTKPKQYINNINKLLKKVCPNPTEEQKTDIQLIKEEQRKLLILIRTYRIKHQKAYLSLERKNKILSDRVEINDAT